MLRAKGGGDSVIDEIEWREGAIAVNGEGRVARLVPDEHLVVQLLLHRRVEIV